MDEEFKRWLVPIEGVLLRHPRTGTVVSKAGGWVPWIGADGRYWRRRVRFGEAVITNPPMVRKSEVITETPPVAEKPSRRQRTGKQKEE